MRKALVVVLVLFVVAAALVMAGGAAEEEADVAIDEECYDSDLDPRYCDRTGDMVADPPADESEWLDPNTLIFAYAPTEDPAVYEEAFEDFVAHLEDELARPVQWYGVRSYAAQVEAMRAGRLHISGFSTGSVEEAVNTAGFVPQTIMGTEDGFVGAAMWVITQPDSDIREPEDLRGREVAFVSETSNSGYFAPRAIFYEEFDMLPGEDYNVTFSGSHDNSILGVLNEDYEAASISEGVLWRMVEAGRVPDFDAFHYVYKSEPFTPSAYGVTHRLAPELQERIKQAFLSYDWEGTLLDETWPAEDRFIPVNYEEDYAILRMVARGSQAVAEILGE